MAQKKQEKVLITLETAEVTLWAVVPKAKWEQKTRTTEEILELVEKQVTGQTLREAIAEATEDVALRVQGVPESLERQLQALVAALEDAELTVEPTEETAQMTAEELNQAENSLLHPEEPPVWDSPSA